MDSQKHAMRLFARRAESTFVQPYADRYHRFIPYAIEEQLRIVSLKCIELAVRKFDEKGALIVFCKYRGEPMR